MANATMYMKRLTGMAVFDHDGTGILELQKNDAVGVYESDAAAWADFISILSTANTDYPTEGVRAIAVKLLENWRPYMERVMRGRMVAPPVR